MHFFYDAQSKPAMVEFNGAVYSYVHNLQGDIVGIVDSAGSLVVEYKYDAWGKSIAIYGALASTLGELNPFRYRCYSYDEETTLYYNATRYYNPAIGRMLSPDLYSTALESLDVLADKNYFAYTDNNPLMRVDADGLFWDTLLDIVSVVGSVVDVISNPADPIAWVSLAADVVSLAVPGVTGGGHVVRAITKSDDVVDAAKQVYRAADKASDIRKATGSYEILYKSGKNYVGKGGFKRMITSASRPRMYNGVADEVVSATWKRAKNTREAFIDEYLKQRQRGVLSSNINANTYNRIWSPGRKYYYQDYGRY